MLTFHVTRMEVGGQKVQHAVQKRGALQNAIFKITENQKASQTNGNAMLRPSKELRSRDLTSHPDNSQLTTSVLAFMFGGNTKPHLLKALGSLAKKASR